MRLTLLILGLQLSPEFIHLCELCCDELIDFRLTLENLHCAKWVEEEISIMQKKPFQRPMVLTMIESSLSFLNIVLPKKYKKRP